MSEPGIDFEGLSNRLRKERQGAPERLTKLEPGFYAEAEGYLRALAEEAHRETAANPAGSKGTLLADELRNARRALEDFYDLREHKVVALALGAARGAAVETQGMTRGEHELFDHLVRILRDARRGLLRHGGAGPADPPRSEPAWPQEARPVPAGPPAAPAAERPPAPPPERPLPVEAAPRPAESGPRVMVRVLEAVPRFTGSDLRTYSLAPQDVVALPREAAKALVLNGKATYVTGA